MLLLKREAPKLWVMTSPLGEGNTRPDPEIEFESDEFKTAIAERRGRHLAES
jgi:hypothetical protein